MAYTLYDNPKWRDASDHSEKSALEEEYEELRLLVQLVQLLDKIDREVKQGPRIAPPDEFWMDPE